MGFSKSVVLGASAIALLLAGAYFALHGAGSQTSSQRTSLAPMTIPTAKLVIPDLAGPVRIVMQPDSNEPPAVYRFHKDDDVVFLISVPFDGMLAIHGYPIDRSIKANQELRLPVKLEHTGRFPMHVHDKDGQHIEVAVIEILPK